MIQRQQHQNQKFCHIPWWAEKGWEFIGSTAVGKERFALAGKLGKEASINGNGKNHVVIMPDVMWIGCERIATRRSYGITGSAAWVRTILLFARNAYEAVKETLIDASATLHLGYGLE